MQNLPWEPIPPPPQAESGYTGRFGTIKQALKTALKGVPEVPECATLAKQIYLCGRLCGISFCFS
jgi:hypothetical protein